MSYKENEQVLVTEGQGYNLTTRLDFDCEVFNFATDNVMVHFVINEQPLAKFVDTRNPDTVSDTSVIQFKSGSNFR